MLVFLLPFITLLLQERFLALVHPLELLQQLLVSHQQLEQLLIFVPQQQLKYFLLFHQLLLVIVLAILGLMSLLLELAMEMLPILPFRLLL